MTENKTNAEEATLLPDRQSETALPIQQTENTEPTALPEQEQKEADTSVLPAQAEVDYAALAEEDLAEIKRLSPAFSDLSHLSELPHADRFAALRDLGLSVAEALAASHPVFAYGERENGKAHLRPTVPHTAHLPRGSLSGQELAQARALFGDLSDSQINALYRRVNR